jgi:hypothetical protein
MTAKWTPGEKAVAGEQVDSMANATPHKTFDGALVLVAENLALQRNALRDALEEALKTAEFEKPAYRGWHRQARKVLAKCK